jgi:uncharacterized membrane protein (UPF0182 family)
MKTKTTAAILGAILIVGLALLVLFVKYYADWLWFKNLGYTSVFVTMLCTKVLAFSAFFLLFGIWGGVNMAVARKSGHHTRSLVLVGSDQPVPTINLIFRYKYAGFAWGLIILFLSVVMGLAAAGSWETFLKFFHGVQFGVVDPIFSKDVGFYVFKLPFYKFAQDWYLYSISLVFILVGLSYYFDQAISFQGGRFYVLPKAKYHLSVLGGLFFLGTAWVYRLKLYSMLYSTRGVAYGASYTDIHAQIPAYWVLLILTLVFGLLLFVVPALGKWKLVTYGIEAYLIVLVGFVWIYPNFLQQYVVKPNEVTKEAPYIENNIKFTRLAYGLNHIEEKDFPVQQTLSYKDIQKNHSTIENIRLWDRRPLIETYKQLQEIRLYYDFKNVDVDRYRFKKYLQVALAVRELPPSQIPSRARTWVNTHLKYTHGYGLVMNPVNEVTAEGMPYFIVKDIPPQSDVALNITRPEIYYGEETDEYAIVRTKTEEFDYPKGDHNVYTTYTGDGGVELSNAFRRLVYAWEFSDLKIFLTGYITHQSRIMYHRIITDRDRTIAPFLTYDSDPYIVVGRNGKLYWIHDAYTTTNMYPYSEPISESIQGRGLNYIRNSVKVVIDAYNGVVNYYVVDPTDPVIQTYKRIFPSLFKTMDNMPTFLKEHFRYPTDMFQIQAQMYSVYHMTSPQVFYNQEDYWNIPREVYQDTEQPMFPYYIIMRLPKGRAEEFILMLPLTPSKKNNMVAWMCARCDFPNYGELIVYKLPKEKLIYGPMQIEARINQKPDISSELTLWGQKGSRVIRGNLLIIPIENSFIYVEPIYLQSEQSQMPELKRVVAAFGDKLEMKQNLDAALRAVFSAENMPTEATKKAIAGSPTGTLSEMAQRALHHYKRAIRYLRQGNWAKYGEELDRLRQILQGMTRKK